MFPKALYNNCDCRYSFHRLHDLNLPFDDVEVLKNQAQKIACLVHQRYLTRKPNGWEFTEDVPTLAKQQEMMLNAVFGEDEAFRNEFTPGFGTAFLVTNQLVLTAAHCFCHEGSSELNTKLVEATKLVFGFHEVKENRSDYFFTKDQVYTVTVVAYQHFRAPGRNTAYSEWTDWALLKLDRKVAFEPLPLNLNKVVDKIELYMLGHPNGLPLKFTYNGKIEGNTESDFFECKLDAFRGNSGSPVFNRLTKQIEGILIEGGEDYQVVSNYRGTGQKRIQTSYISKSEIFSNQIGKRMENCQRLDVLRHLVDKDLLDLEFEENSPELVVQSLKESYKRRNTITRLLDQPLPIDTIYTELVLLDSNKETDKEKEKKTFEEHRINSWEDIHAVKEPIKLDVLFENREGKSPKRLLILGRAGIGKSTLCQYIANQWAQSKLWKGKFDAVFWVPLRKLQNVHSAETAASILFRLCCQEGKLFTRDVRDYLNQNSNRVLLILDGLDEMTLAEDSRQKKILDEFLKFPHWILTSRPHAVGSIQADATIENVGYDSKTIDLYIQKSFQDQATTIIQKIRQNPIIFGLCHIPINLELICAILKKSKGNLSKISSMTSLYEELTLVLQRRFLEKMGKPEAWNWEPLEINQEVNPVFNSLEKIAWTAMEEGQLVFSLEDNLQSLCTSGFLQSTQAGEYSFLHLTFQEFFAARYLVNLLQVNPKDASECVQAVKFDPRYKVVMWFTSGLLRKEEGDFRHLNAFFEMLDTPKDLAGLYGTLLKVRCLEECGWQKKLQKIKFYEEEIKLWLEKMVITTKNDLIQKHLVETFEVSPLGAKWLFIPKLRSCLSNFRREGIKILGHVGHADPHTVIPVLIGVLQDKDNYYSIVALLALGQVGLADPKTVIPVLLKALQDKSKDVRNAAAKALYQIAQVDSKAVINPLLDDLQDKNDIIRACAVEALVITGQANPKAVIPALLKSLQDKHDFVRSTAAEALGKVGMADPNAVISTLLKTLQDKTNHVRLNAVKALGQIGEADPKTVIPALLKALQDVYGLVRGAAAKALGQIGHADPNAVIPPLLDAIKDDQEELGWKWVTSSAEEALGQIGLADPNAVIPPLIKALKDNNKVVAGAATNALGLIGHANPKAVIPALLESLKDKSIRSAAIKALGVVGQADPKAVILPLIEALNDQDNYVREAAAKALGQIGRDYPEVIPPLIKALKDKDELVREVALIALGRIGQANPKSVLPSIFDTLKENKDFARATISVMNSPNQTVPQTALNKYDISPYLKSYPFILDPTDDWSISLTSTPLSSLITCYKKDPSPSFIYSLAITKKCIEENLPIFQIKNALCFYEQGKLCSIDFPNAHLFIIQLEQRMGEYPIQKLEPKSPTIETQIQQNTKSNTQKTESCTIQ